MLEHAVEYLTTARDGHSQEIERLERSIAQHRAIGNTKVVTSLEGTVARLKEKHKSLNAAITLITA